MKKVLLFLLLLYFFSPLRCCLAGGCQTMFVGSGRQPDNPWHTVDAVCRLYGLAGRSVSPVEAISELSRPKSNEHDVLAVVIDASCLGSGAALSQAKTLWDCIKGARVPTLILCSEPLTFALPEHGRADIIVRRCKGAVSGWHVTQVNPDLTRELTGISGAVEDEDIEHAAPVIASENLTDSLEPLMTVRLDGGASWPVFAQLKAAKPEVFVAAFDGSTVKYGIPSKSDVADALPTLVPVLTFLRFAAGQYCWHGRSDYANLTIDDPWLVEPYGHLSYRGLLAEMKKVGFHTTIAFIPWNYDRSKPAVVSLLKEHQDYFSICVHGNDHDHREFYRYKTSAADPWPAKPLDVQETNIRQALARMEPFKTHTGLSYDPVMVFPHNIAPSKTLALLKKYGFLATCNATNVPLGAAKPSDRFFGWRPVTLDFENFPSLKRYTPDERSQSDIAIDLFLDNPLLFFGHHDLFTRGADAFNKRAELVNHLGSSVEWQSLGDICRHYYLQKLREDGNYDVRAFFSSIELENEHDRDLTYFVHKEESFSPPVLQVTIDGESYPYKKRDGYLSLCVVVPAHESRAIDIQYDNKLDLTSVDIAKNDHRVNRLRRLSDFRDMTLSKNVLGRAIIYVYYGTDLYKLGLKRLAAISFGPIIVIFLATVFLMTYRRKHRPGHEVIAESQRRQPTRGRKLQL